MPLDNTRMIARELSRILNTAVQVAALGEVSAQPRTRWRYQAFANGASITFEAPVGRFFDPSGDSFDEFSGRHIKPVADQLALGTEPGAVPPFPRDGCDVFRFEP